MDRQCRLLHEQYSTVRSAWLVLGWVTIFGRYTTSVCNLAS